MTGKLRFFYKPVLLIPSKESPLPDPGQLLHLCQTHDPGKPFFPGLSLFQMRCRQLQKKFFLIQGILIAAVFYIPVEPLQPLVVHVQHGFPGPVPVAFVRKHHQAGDGAVSTQGVIVSFTLHRECSGVVVV
jgi:hypothetical protein